MALASLRMKTRPLVTGASAVYPHSPELEARFRFEGKYKDADGNPDVVLLHRREGKLIHLPRALCPVGIEDARVDGEAVTFPQKPAPRPHQAEVTQATIAFLQAGHSGQVCAYTGFGKTVIGYAAAHAVQRKTLVITTKEDIYEQWIAGACGYDRVKKEPCHNFLGLTPAEVGEIRGDKCEVMGTKFCVALIQSLSKEGKYPDWVVEGFGLVIFDECHRLPADMFSRVADMFPARLRLGLSATPERGDGKEPLVEAHIGPIRVQTQAELMVPKVLRYKSGWKCPRIPVKNAFGGVTMVPIPHTFGRTAKVEDSIAHDAARNALIAKLIAMALDKGRRIAVFSTRIEHLDLIGAACVSSGMTPDLFGVYVGEAKKSGKLERNADKTKPVLLTTYGMCGEGTDLPWLDTALLAMPRASVTQPVGRIRRIFEGKKEPLVLDILDTDSKVLAAYARKRLKWYNAVNCNIKDYL